MKRTLLLLAAGLMLHTTMMAQDLTVPSVPAGTITIDGMGDEVAWDTGLEFDLIANTDWWSGDFPDVDIVEAFAKALYTEDTLFVYVFIDDNELFFKDGEPWNSDQILVGVDAPNEGADNDDNFEGWPDNAPDLGPTSYRISTNGVTQAGSEVDAEAEGWVLVETFVDEDNQDWGAEIAIVLDKIEAGAEIGFNIGGAQASADADANGDGPYGYFSFSSTNFPGGDINHDASSYVTLTMQDTSGGEGYGTGVTVQVPQADASAMVMDGMADEAAWDNAQSSIDLLENVNFYALVSEPDLAAESKLLWSADTLYIYVRMFDNAFFIPEASDAWQADQILIGIDPVHEDGVTDEIVDGEYGGFTENAPDAGPYTYKVWPVEDGITLNWGFDGVFPLDSMWVQGTVFRDDQTLEWGVEMAAYVPGLEEGSEIGFNIGGAQASQEAADSGGEGTYGFFSWQAVQDPGGDVQNRSASFATLRMVQDISEGVEEESTGELPSQFVLRQNYPNPFNPTTTIEYGLQRSARATLDVYDALGRRLATLVNAQRPAGTYRVQWTADDLPSGVYFYQLKVDGQLVQSKTMLLVK